MTPQEKTYLQYGIAAIALTTVLYFAFSDTTVANGAGTDPTGNNDGPGGTAAAFNAKNTAEDLYDAMREMGTDEDVVINTLRYVSPGQFILVFKEFGKRQYNKSLGNQYNLNPFTQLPFVDLKGWLQSELSVAEYANLKRKYPTKL